MLVSGRHQGARKSTGATAGSEGPGDAIREARGEASEDARAATARVIAAVREGRGGALFPPLAGEGLGRLLKRQRWLSGAADARALEEVLARPRFAPLRAAFAELEREGRRWRAAAGARIAAGLLEELRPELFGGVVADCYTACALAPRQDAAELVELLRRGFSSAVQSFLERLLRDLAAGVLAPGRGAAARARRAAANDGVIGLVAYRAETHSGGQFAIAVELRSGAKWVYKPRPGDGERALLGQRDAGRAVGGKRARPRAGATAPASLFEHVNQLPGVAGEPRLPTLRVRAGSGADGAWYSWHEWVEAPRYRPVVTASEKAAGRIRTKHYELRSCRLPVGEAARFWYRAGCVSSACLAFGATDLFSENVKIGKRVAPEAADELWPYPIDLEMIGYPLRTLTETGLLEGGARMHRPGLGRYPSRRADDGPLAFHRWSDGAGKRRLELAHVTRWWQREVAPELVTDTAGNLGSRAYLPAYLRGMFDVWLTLLHHREELQAWLRDQPAPLGRVVVRPTASYAAVLDAALTGRRRRTGGEEPARGGAAKDWGPAPKREPAWSLEERAQLARLDVPYFLAPLGGALHTLTPPPSSRLVRVDEQPRVVPLGAATTLAQRLDAMSLPALGVAMRDVVLNSAAELQQPFDRRRGVLVARLAPQRGFVTINWREAGKRLCFRWSGRDVKVEVTPLQPGRVAAPELRRQLLRMDRLDSALRQRFQESGFRDRATEQAMERLVGTAVTWLKEVVAKHGWPGRTLVGERAAAAACRLAQHADRFPAFQRRCLALVEEAVRIGEVPPPQRAYLFDQVRIRAGKKQRYGTKFRRMRGELVPFPLEQEERVDYFRGQVGLGSLARYARKVRRLFGDKPAQRGGAQPPARRTARRRR